MIERFVYILRLLISALFLLSVIGHDAFADGDIYINTGTLNINGVARGAGKNAVLDIDVGQYLYSAGSPMFTDIDPAYPYAIVYYFMSGGSAYVPALGISAFYVQLGNNAKVQVALGLRNETGADRWVANTGTTIYPAVYDKPNSTVIMTIFTDANGLKGVGTYSMNNIQIGRYSKCPTATSQAVECIGGGDIFLKAILNVEHSACAITTAHDMSFVWTPLSPSAIANGAAGEKIANISMECGTNATPISVTFTSTNGYYDADNGIVNTDKDNLGIQLNWQKTGAAIQLNKSLDISAADIPVTDFNISAKPVQTGDGKITGGAFSTAVTMSVEYR